MTALDDLHVLLDEHAADQIRSRQQLACMFAEWARSLRLIDVRQLQRDCAESYETARTLYQERYYPQERP